MKKQGLSRQQRREARQRQERSGAYGVNVPFRLPPGVSQAQFQEIAAREWREVTGGAGVVLVDGKPFDAKGGA